MSAGAESGPPDEIGEPVHLPIEDSLDLHSFRPADVPSVVEEYLAQAHARGFAEVRLIHGRGIGVQRSIVQSLLAQHPLVNAPEDRGGRGATLVRLRPPRSD
jgi:DNA-nicking Smr family endonuclease